MSERLNDGERPKTISEEYKMSGTDVLYRKIDGTPKRVDEIPAEWLDDASTPEPIEPQPEPIRAEQNVHANLLDTQPVKETHEAQVTEAMSVEPPPPRHENKPATPTKETSGEDTLQRTFSGKKIAAIALLATITVPVASYGTNQAFTYAFTKGGESVGMNEHGIDFIEAYINTDEE